MSENDSFDETDAKIAAVQRGIARMEMTGKYHFCQFGGCMRRVPMAEWGCAEHTDRTRQPFDDKEVLFRFVPTAEEQKKSGNLYAEECVLVENYFSFIALWQHYPNGSWFRVSPYTFLFRLLNEHTTLTAAFATACEVITELGRDLGEKEHWQDLLADLASHCKDKADRSDIAHGQIVGKLRQRVTTLETEKENLEKQLDVLRVQGEKEKQLVPGPPTLEQLKGIIL